MFGPRTVLAPLLPSSSLSLSPTQPASRPHNFFFFPIVNFSFMAEKRQQKPPMAAGEESKRAGAAAQLPGTEALATNFVGRHRLAAYITHLQNQINILQVNRFHL